MVILDSEERTITSPEQFILVNQLEPRVKIVLIKKVDGRFSRVAIEILHFTRTSVVVAAPDESRGPVTTLERLVVLHGSGRAPDVSSRRRRLWLPQETVAHLDRPVLVGRKRQAGRTRVPWVCFEVIAILVRFAAVEDRTFQLEPAISESGG